MADGKTGLVVKKGDVGDGVAGRHILRLHPVFTAVIGINNVSIFTHGDQPVAYFGHIKDQRLGGSWRLIGIFIRLNRPRMSERRDHTENAEKGRCQQVEFHHVSPIMAGNSRPSDAII